MAFGIKSIVLRIRENYRKPRDQRWAFPEDYFEELDRALKRRKQMEQFEFEEAVGEDTD